MAEPGRAPSPELAAWRSVPARIRRATRVPPRCQPAQQVLLRQRVVALARLTGVLTLLWIPLDIAWLPGLHPATVAMRIALAAALFLLAAFTPRLSAGVAATLLAWVQALGFGLLQWLIDPRFENASEIGYGLFPFFIVAQLAMLPMAWPRGLLFAAAPALQLASVLTADGMRLPAMASDAWLFALLTVLATWASQAQLRMLCELLAARLDAAHDPLTGLANRRTAAERLDAEVLRARRLGAPLSVLMLDLDHFKRVNDRWGHADGDLVLVAVARTLRDQLRGIDLAVRFGGEEFLAILPDTSSQSVMDVAERIRAWIETHPILLPATSLSITTSIGAATLAPHETAAHLLLRADAALYAAKHAGRNRCVLATEQQVQQEGD